jgi:hypothetical protein
VPQAPSEDICRSEGHPHANPIAGWTEWYAPGLMTDADFFEHPPVVTSSVVSVMIIRAIVNGLAMNTLFGTPFDGHSLAQLPLI